jgi:hypothetical protein
MVYYQKLFRRCSQHWTGGGEGETKFVLSMFNNFVILAGLVSRVLSKIVACLKTLNETIQVEINKITDKLSINTAKTKLILFRSKNKKPKCDLKISIKSETIKQVKIGTQCVHVACPLSSALFRPRSFGPVAPPVFRDLPCKVYWNVSHRDKS